MVELKSVTLIGVGLIGGSIGLSLGRKNPEVHRVGVGRPATLEKALGLGLIDEAVPREDFERDWTPTDLVVLATPIAAIFDWLERIAPLVNPSTVVTDVGSTKREIVEKAAQVLPNPGRFVGGHPMAGSERRGVLSADAFLFENATYVLTPTESTDADAYELVADLAVLLGARVVRLDPVVHDRIAAAVSHLPQLLAVALVNYVGMLHEEDDRTLRLAAGGFRDMTRIASSPYDVWHDILATNQDEIQRVLDEFHEAIHDLQRDLKEQQLGPAFERAAKYRLSIPRDTKGFLHPLFDVLVAVEDKPGVIARISTLLAAEGINIKDIEVLKVREGEGGTIRLALESEKDRQRALALLRDAGIDCRARV